MSEDSGYFPQTSSHDPQEMPLNNIVKTMVLEVSGEGFKNSKHIVLAFL